MPGFVVYYFGKWLKETIFLIEQKIAHKMIISFLFGERRKEQRENAEKNVQTNAKW